METTTDATGAGHPFTRLTFVYDREGRRIAKRVWKGTLASPIFSSSTRWLYDGWNIVTELSATSATTATVTPVNTLTWGPDLSGTLQGAGGVGGLLTHKSVSSGVTERASYDGNGNIVAWTKSTAAARTSLREYDAFGNTLVSEGNSPSSFGFSTKQQDIETGAYYYGYRYYSPVDGRWISRDPIEEDGGINLFTFVFNRPITHSDFLGLKLTAYKVGSAEVKPFPANSKQSEFTGGYTESKPFLDHAKMSAKQNPNDPSCVDVTVSGKFTIAIFINTAHPGMLTELDNFGNTLLQHERQHELYRGNAWNGLKEDVDRLEGTWKKNCASIIQKMFAAEVYEHQLKTNLENAQFEQHTYGNKLDARSLASLKASIKQLTEAIVGAEEAVNNAAMELGKAGCVKQ